MKRIAVGCVALFGFVALSQAQGDASGSFRPFYEKLDRYLLAHRYDQIQKLLNGRAHPHFTYVDEGNRRHSYTRFLQNYKDLLDGRSRVLKSLTRVDRTATEGSTTLVTTTGYGTVRRWEPNGKPHILDVVVQTKDTWVKTAGEWRVRELRVTSVKMTRDGKPVRVGGFDRSM